jgi:aryl-alcohol dehydrogenase-like predicted oxidoreductase
MACSWDKVELGSTGLKVCPLGLASGYGIGTKDTERAIERGLNYLYWGTRRTDAFCRAVRCLSAARRADMVVVVQSYQRFAWLLRRSVESALREARLEYADVLLLGWWNALPSRRILDAARGLREAGKIKNLMISGHKRLSFGSFIEEPACDAVMVRYNAAHTGAEKEVFPHLAKRRVGVAVYTATRWGNLPDPKHTPPGERTPRGSDCYRFVLSNPNVDVVVTGARNGAELDEAMSALDRGPLSGDEDAWMRRVGAHIRGQKTFASKFGD